MADLDPRVPQVNDPQLEADLLAALSIVGRVGKLNVSDLVIPTVQLLTVREPMVNVAQPVMDRGGIFQGQAIAPAAGATIVDTGNLTVGTYDITCVLSNTDNTTQQVMRILHRNAGASGNIYEISAALASDQTVISWAIEVIQNERLIVVVKNAAAAGTEYAASILMHLRD